MAAEPLILQNATRLSGERCDVGISGGRIVAPESLTGAAQWDLEGRVILPGLVDAHVHLDKTLSLGSDGLENESGTLQEAITRWQAVKATRSLEDYLTRAEAAVRLASRHGTTALRTHVDIDKALGLRALEALLELRGRVANIVDLQIVALGRPGVDRAGDDLMRAALSAGADFVGGAPALCPDPAQAVRTALDIAEAAGKPIDLHIDETDDVTMRTLEVLADETTARGLQGLVTAGHCVSLGAMPHEDAERIIDKVAAAELNVITLPAVNLVLQGRADRERVWRGLTRVKALLGAGVRVAAASDNVRDPFNPLGNYDLVWLANLSAHAAHLTGRSERDTVWDLVTTNPATMLGRTSHFAPGDEADLVILESTDPAACLAEMPGRYAVFKRGTLVHGSLVHGIARETA